ncbi:hypothetical protein BHECKSOX_1114 [Bathymodiolus heckerae thiotrophic gill symbiont]|uniref:hypothetical protein n=1 Tax=Bathymodiolus heckerae thiotrophic gill symbiont TaxID=1052212 RepID=UPI0010BA9473|nr:hypothetical protein [Bathymodiolus heckerae thiotrophic gill symbiont]SHN92600.1 hypothetical protein BHECKSOX_1114 [Bathymodiolus heckerae thiotrophic gill symbiont]
MMITRAIRGFLRFNFEFGGVKARSRSDVIKSEKLTLDVKEVEEVKDTRKSNNIEQSIDELLAADMEALKELNQKTGQNLPDEIKTLDVKLKVIDLENIKQSK